MFYVTTIIMDVPATRLTGLPPELMHRIFSLLGRSTLIKLSLTCRYIYEIVQPILYTTITQSSETPDVLSYLLRTLLEKPDLAVLIKRFDGESLALEEDLDMSILTDEHFSQIRSTVMKQDIYGRDTCRMWMESFRFGTEGTSLLPNYDAVIAVLLILLSDKLETLKLVYQQGNHYHTNIVVAQMSKLQQNKTVKSSLWNLRSVHIISPIMKATDHLSFGTIIPFLELRSLRKLTADGLDGGGRPNLHLKHGKSFNILDLDVRGWFDTATMESLLKCFNCLKHLRCYQYGEAYGNAVLYSSAFTHGLSHLKESLESFEFENNASAERYDDEENPYLEDESEIDLDAFYAEPIKKCNMKDYKKLKTYKFSAYFHEKPDGYDDYHDSLSDNGSVDVVGLHGGPNSSLEGEIGGGTGVLYNGPIWASSDSDMNEEDREDKS